MKVAVNNSEIFNPKNIIEYSSGGIVSKQISMNPSGNVSLFAIDEGQSLSEHSAPFDAMAHILEGEAEIVINKVPYHLKENDMIIMPADIPHSLLATKSFKMLLTMIKDKKKIKE